MLIEGTINVAEGGGEWFFGHGNVGEHHLTCNGLLILCSIKNVLGL